MKLQQTKIRPTHLKLNDTIGIVSTARKISKTEIEFSLKLFKSWGLNIVLGDNLFGNNHQFSGTVKERTADFQKMLDNKSIKAIICARGGYGTVQIIDELNFTSFKEYPKWVVGYSDVTVLHSHLNKFGCQSLHASMPINFEENTEESIESLKNALFGHDLQYSFNSHPFNRNGKCRAEVVGGNLSILYSLLSSPSELDLEDKILFIEDLDEYLYHIDRIMMNLKRNKSLSKLAGIIVGSMTKMHDNEVPFGKSVEEIIYDSVKEYSFPVCFNFPAGHQKNNLALPLGKRATLDVNKTSTLKYGSTQ